MENLLVPLPTPNFYVPNANENWPRTIVVLLLVYIKLCTRNVRRLARGPTLNILYGLYKLKIDLESPTGVRNGGLETASLKILVENSFKGEHVQLHWDTLPLETL